jgi:CRP-like cAMP-binding protein/serine/threonine protein phosphatase PrpC
MRWPSRWSSKGEGVKGNVRSKQRKRSAVGSPDVDPEASVKSRVAGIDAAERFPLGSKSGFTLRYAALSQRGYNPEEPYVANQDRYLCLPRFNKKDDQMLIGVFDGHGADGDAAADFVKAKLGPELIKAMSSGSSQFDFRNSFHRAFASLDQQMKKNEAFDASYSGCTAISAFFRGGEMTIANIGDSRAILGERRGKRVIAHSLSVDHTCYRRDERERVKTCGAVVMTLPMAKGEAEYTLNWELNMDEDQLEAGEAPRIFVPDTLYPAHKITRSIGDSMSAHIGLDASAELLQKQLREPDQFVLLATDGIWEFLTNQMVCDAVIEHVDPVDACGAIVAQAYALWLQFEVLADDITLILAYIDTDEGPAPRPASDEELAEVEAVVRGGRRLSLAMMGGLDDRSSQVVAGGEARPVRRGLSEERKTRLGMQQKDMQEDALDEKDMGDWKLEVVPKTEAEIQRIKAAMNSNFLFQKLSESQSTQIYDAMKRKRVKAGEIIIRQGDPGDEFYVLEIGEYVVTIENNGKAVEVLRYRPNPSGANPCFGELALMYSKPRAATVTAATDGILWAIDRRSFREILKRSSAEYLMRTLRSVQILKPLTSNQLQRLSERLSEKTYKGGETIIRQGEYGDTFFIVSEGKAAVIKDLPEGERSRLAVINQGQFFGERALLRNEPRAANVVAEECDPPLRCLYIAKSDFEETLGSSLQEIIDADTEWRYKMSLLRQMKKKAAGLANLQIEQFEMHGITATTAPTQYMLATLKNKEYTIRAQSKMQVVEMGLKQRLRNELKLLHGLHGHRTFVPLELQTVEDDAYIYSIYPTRVACTLDDVMALEPGGFEDETAMFYAACLVMAIEHLQSEVPTGGGVCIRNLTPQAITIDENGYPQLIDLRYATTAQPQPRDYCGFAHYLAPEQVAGLGHGHAADFWALGVLIYEMSMGKNPWLTGEKGKDTEIPVYGRITAHQAGMLSFPVGRSVDPHLAELLNMLMEPDPAKRLGAKYPFLVKDLREHEWFGEYQWGELSRGNIMAPHRDHAVQAIEDCLSMHQDLAQSDIRDHYLSEVYEGDNTVFAGLAGSTGLLKEHTQNLAEVIMTAARSQIRNKLLHKRKKAKMRKRGEEVSDDEDEAERAPASEEPELKTEGSESAGARESPAEKMGAEATSPSGGSRSGSPGGGSRSGSPSGGSRSGSPVGASRSGSPGPIAKQPEEADATRGLFVAVRRFSEAAIEAAQDMVSQVVVSLSDGSFNAGSKAATEQVPATPGSTTPLAAPDSKRTRGYIYMDDSIESSFV